MDYVIPPGGVSAASFFEAVPFVDPAAPLGVLADKLDGRGELASVIAGQHPVDAAIAYQFRVRRGSGASVRDDGQAFADIRKNDGQAEGAIRFEALRVMQPFVDRGDVQIVSFSVQAGEAAGDLGAVFLQYRNLRTGQLRPAFKVS